MSGRLKQLRDSIWRAATPQRLSTYLAVYLITNVAMFLYMESTYGVIDRLDRVRGRDFSTFYVTGEIVRDGEGDQLYDQKHFRERQEELASITEKRPPNASLYPPLVPLIFSWLARLSYGDALILWWAGLVICFSIGGWWLVRDIEPDPAWKRTVILAIAAFTPIYYTFLNGQLSAVLLLTFLAGLNLHRRGYVFLAGLMLSLLALKPQFAVGPFLWMLLRRDFRTLAGYCLGGLGQAAVSAAALGPKILMSYLNNLWTLPDILKFYHPTPDHGHSLGEVLTIVLGNDYVQFCNLVHLGAVAVSAFWFFRTIYPKGRTPMDSNIQVQHLKGPIDESIWNWRIEYSALVLFSLLLSPHLLTYDVSMLLIPIAFLWSGKMGIGLEEERWLGGILYLAAMITFIYYIIGFSLVPAAMLWSLFQMSQFAKRTSLREQPKAEDALQIA